MPVSRRRLASPLTRATGSSVDVSSGSLGPGFLIVGGVVIEVISSISNDSGLAAEAHLRRVPESVLQRSRDLKNRFQALSAVLGGTIEQPRRDRRVLHDVVTLRQQAPHFALRFRGGEVPQRFLGGRRDPITPVLALAR